MNILPPAFSSLDRLVEKWAKPTENLRSQQRWESTKEEFLDFYENTLPLLDGILDHLSRYPIGTLSGSELTLYHLALSFAEMAPHVEMYRCSTEVPFSFDADRFEAIHGNLVNN